MKTVVLSLVLGAALAGQLPPLPEPSGQPLPLPPLPREASLPAPPGGFKQDEKKPAPLLYVHPEVPGTKSPSSANFPGPPAIAPPAYMNSLKPAPLKLVAPEVKLPEAARPPLPGMPPQADVKVQQGLTVQHFGPANVKAGQPFCYDIVVRNLGAAPVTTARLEEELPPGTKLVSAVPPPAIQGDRVLWNLDNIVAGGERRFQLEVVATRDGDWKTQAQLSVVVRSSLQARVTGAPAQDMLTVGGPTTVPAGHPAAFPIRVTNSTPAALTDAVLRVEMSPGLQHLQGERIEGPLGDLAPGQSKELTLEVVCTQTGKQTLDLAVLGGGKAAVNAQVVVFVVEQPTLALRQTGPVALSLGGEYEFKLEAVNRGSTEVRDVAVADLLPEGLQFLGGDPSAVYDPAGRTVRWNVGTLAAGQTRQLVFRAAARSAGPQFSRASIRAAGGNEALLHTIVRIAPRP